MDNAQNGLKVWVIEPFSATDMMDEMKIYLIDRYPDGVVTFNIEKGGAVVGTKLSRKESEGKVHPPFIHMTGTMGREFLQQIVEYANDKGINPHKSALEATIEGLNEQIKEKERHLMDMRLLVFKQKPRL